MSFGVGPQFHVQSKLFFVSLLLFLCSISAATITPGSYLYASNPNETWSSRNRTFSLGFLPSDPPTSPPSFIVAIFYAGGVPIWSAVDSNGSPAFVDSGGALHFLSFGSLRLVNGSNATVWNSNIEGLGVTSALLDEFGNLVFRNGSASVWSVACIFAELVTKQALFPGDSELQQLLHIFRLLGTPNEGMWPGVSKLMNWHEYPQWNPQSLPRAVPNLDDNGLDLLAQMLHYEPSKRISAKKAMEHPYFDDLNKAGL